MSVVSYIPGRPGETQAESGPLTLAELKHALRVDIDHDDAMLTRNLRAATLLANRQAPDAPADIRTESIIRCVSWLYDGREPDGNINSVWIRSGAKSLLNPWTVRRAGLIEADD